MVYKIFILCLYNGTIVHDMNNIITYNSWSSLSLNVYLGMSYAEMKETIYHGLEWNYNDIDV